MQGEEAITGKEMGLGHYGSTTGEGGGLPGDVEYLTSLEVEGPGSDCLKRGEQGLLLVTSGES